jgi:hypothetical protein
MRGLTIDELDNVSGGFSKAFVGGGGVSQGSDLAMIQIQSLMSQRQQVVTMVTNMMQSLGDTSKNVANNIGK